MCTGLCSNFYSLLKTTAILADRYSPAVDERGRYHKGYAIVFIYFKNIADGFLINIYRQRKYAHGILLAKTGRCIVLTQYIICDAISMFMPRMACTSMAPLTSNVLCEQLRTAAEQHPAYHRGHTFQLLCRPLVCEVLRRCRLLHWDWSGGRCGG